MVAFSHAFNIKRGELRAITNPITAECRVVDRNRINISVATGTVKDNNLYRVSN